MKRWEYASLFVDFDQKFLTLSGVASMHGERLSQLLDGLNIEIKAVPGVPDDVHLTVKPGKLFGGGEEAIANVSVARTKLLNGLGEAGWEAYSFCVLPKYSSIYALKRLRQDSAETN